MLEINASAFLDAATELRRLNTILESNDDLRNDDSDISPSLRGSLLGSLEKVIGAIEVIGARAAGVAAHRLKTHLQNGEIAFTTKNLDQCLHDIEGRFADEVGFIKLFVIDGNKAILFGSAESLIGSPSANAFPSLWFDCEEAAKCLCLGRSTACVFHSMRMLEVGIKAFARKLDIDDPAKPADRNWGVILRTIKSKIDAEYPASKRLPGTEGAFLESLYATLDAVKNPWRNATMHVENIYTEEEARHILTNVASFIQKMATGFDETGRPISRDLLPDSSLEVPHI
jgi:hypothetical protein